MVMEELNAKRLHAGFSWQLILSYSCVYNDEGSQGVPLHSECVFDIDILRKVIIPGMVVSVLQDIFQQNIFACFLTQTEKTLSAVAYGGSEFCLSHSGSRSSCNFLIKVNFSFSFILRGSLLTFGLHSLCCVVLCWFDLCVCCMTLRTPTSVVRSLF